MRPVLSSFSQIDSEAKWHQRLEQALHSLTGGQATFVELVAPAAPQSGPSEDVRRKVLLPGSFNPLHQGHVGMANWVSQQLGLPVWFEMSFVNADKPVAFLNDIRERLRWQWIQPASQDGTHNGLSIRPHGLMLSGNARFLKKARTFPGSLFAVGMDTITRVADARFYDNRPDLRDEAMAEIADLGCNFLVFGRLRGPVFQTLESTDLPSCVLDLCEPVGEMAFREDISSTELRRRNEP